MASSEPIDDNKPDDDHHHRHELVVEMSTNSPSEPPDSDLLDEISPLLPPSVAQKPRINIFSIPYSRSKAKGQLKRVVETEVSLCWQFLVWMWSGSKYSGYLCMGFSATIYFVMHVLSDALSVGSIPLFESVFARCMIILISSLVWLRRTGQPIFGPPHIRIILVSRALMGCLSLFSFIYSVQSLPMSQAILLNFTTPMMASLAAALFFQEKPKFVDVGGLVCSYFGLLFIFRPMQVTQGGLAEIGEGHNTYVARINNLGYAVCVGMLSTITGAISYCLIRSGAKSSDQPVVSVLAFGILACPASAIWTYCFQEFVLPDLFSVLLMIVLGVLSFFAEVFLARGLQLEKTGRVANIQYIEVVLLQVLNMSLLRVAPSFGRLAGCLLILLSIGGTIHFGQEKEMT